MSSDMITPTPSPDADRDLCGLRLHLPMCGPLGADHRPAAENVMRLYGVSLLARDRVWDTLRHYRPSDWPALLTYLRQHGPTSKWFS